MATFGLLRFEPTGETHRVTPLELNQARADEGVGYEAVRFAEARRAIRAHETH